MGTLSPTTFKHTCSHAQLTSSQYPHQPVLRYDVSTGVNIPFALQHEWKKHGTCALNYTAFGLDSQREYFETTLELHKANDLFVRL